jgi:hypothetical protein
MLTLELCHKMYALQVKLGQLQAVAGANLK